METNKRKLLQCSSAISHISCAYRSDFAGRGGDSHAPDRQTLTIYDLGNKFIAYSCVLNDVVDVLAEWGSLYVLTRNGLMHALHEKDTQTKLEVLCALNTSSQVSVDTQYTESCCNIVVAEVFKMRNCWYGWQNHIWNWLCCFHLFHWINVYVLSVYRCVVDFK